MVNPGEHLAANVLFRIDRIPVGKVGWDQDEFSTGKFHKKICGTNRI